METTLKLGTQYRSVVIHRTDVNEDKRTVELSFSSEEAIERWYGMEILDHSEGAVDLRRLKRGGALLIDHDPSNQVGVIEKVTIGEDRKGRATVRFGRSAKAEEIFQDVIDEIRQNVSVGYQIYEVKQEKGKGNAPDIFRALRWEPLEISLVSIPADISVGVGRNKGTEVEVKVTVTDGEESPKVEIRTQEEKPKEVRIMAAAELCKLCGSELVDGKCRNTKCDEIAAAQEKVRKMSAGELEQSRVKAIGNLCRTNSLGDNYRDMWITRGSTLEEVADDILKIYEERGKSTPKPASLIGMTERETERFSLARAISACAEKNWGKAPFELEVIRAVADKLNKAPDPHRFYVPFEVLQRPVQAKRDLTVATAGAGGYLVATENIGFIEMLRNRSVCFRMGARRLSGLTGSITIPRESAAGTAYWLVNESTAITESQQTFVQVALTPKNVGAYTEISRQLLLQSSPGVEGIVTDDLARVVAIAADLGGLEGSGASGQPTGISNTSGIGTVTGTSIAYAGVLEFQTDVAGNNVIPLNGGYVTTAAIAALLMARMKASNTYSPLWEGNVWDGSMCGFPAMSTNQVTAASMIFGDWQELVIAEWGTLEVEVNPYANFAAGLIGVRAIYSMDVGVRRPFAFSRATSIT